MELISKIALGGGCHWCTEAVFQSLLGIEKVEQGYVASIDENASFSEAVIVHFKPEIISLETLVEIHLYTHKSTSNHSMRTKYRSAIYTFSEAQNQQSKAIINNFQKEFDNKLITKVYPFHSFKASRDDIQNYYIKNPEKPFCETFINPKLKLVLERFSKQANMEKLKHLIA
ncbi:Peptide methionine sulfoxide reductase MsrA [Mariniflexile rhizosphaerae]|uniref:peptide-methionine (S)-S-oxide reductase n=1 Tax=unclassified Mariniflexile TaxID=2643887 RepID=UPI000CB2DA73|nr:peptide-methionine (S)-S-oxide reductase [Mariniflexile sp. TRM1-10]AXP80012.1 Peptide methionine sulfoxide reductase MsrA [Mariniflexile sp. TRM1-10]PLB20982.1 MAG: Peptide methionine sulfoxide reductase MsrA [Flavobacteriaceae bacterium FS1-H7996/R]